MLRLAPLALAASFCATASADVHVLTATPEGAQEVPPVASAGIGEATITVDDVSGYVHVQGTFSGLNGNITLAHLHGLAPAGVNAGVLVGLDFTGTTSGTFEGSNFLDATRIQGILSGESYVNLHSSAHGSGELRGQATFPLVTYTGTLDGAQAGTASPGTGTYVATIDRNTGMVTIDGTYAGLQGSVNASHLHGTAWFGQPAGLFFGLTNTGGSTGTFNGSAALSAAQVEDVLEGFTYINIHTTVAGGGEIRGQVIDSDLGVPFCRPTDNSTGVPGRLEAQGSPRVVDADVTLLASDLPLNAFGYAIVGRLSGQLFPVMNSTGRICVTGAALGRLGSTIQSTGATGTMTAVIDISNIPVTPPTAIAAGDTWNFQVWHRDGIAGAVSSNFTNAVSIDFR